MNSPIRYEYGAGVVVYRRRFGIVNFILLLGVIFSLSAVTPRTLQHFGIMPIPVAKLSSTGVNSVGLVQPASAEGPQITETTAVVEKGLQSVIEQWTKRNTGPDWSISVQRLGDKPATASFNAMASMEPASLYKLYLLQGINEKIPFNQWSKKYVAGRSVRDCVDAMIRVSDNSCAVAIGDLVGWDRIDSRMKAMGFASSKLNAGEGPHVSATDTAKLLGLLNDGKLVDSDAENFILSSMKNQKFRNGIPAGILGCDVYNKTGDMPPYHHDVAIVKCGSLVYTIVIMSKGGNDKQIADLSRAVNNYLFSRR